MSQPEQYAVFGNPIKHSKSPLIHTLFAQQTAQLMEYGIVEAPVDGFNASAKQFFEQGGYGCNVTAPFKLDAYQFADVLTERAQLAEAVNTLKKGIDGQIIGDTTDGEGLVQDLLRNNVALKGAKILLLGAGGAARGVIQPLLAQNPKQLVITNRTLNKAEALVDVFKSYGSISAQAMESIYESFDVVINSTSAGLSGGLPNVSPCIFGQMCVSYDMSYGSGKTHFNDWAKQKGVTHAYDGLGMLVGQAAESFKLWRGVSPKVEPVLTVLRQELEG